jgi:hypothetical protein
MFEILLSASDGPIAALTVTAPHQHALTILMGILYPRLDVSYDGVEELRSIFLSLDLTCLITSSLHLSWHFQKRKKTRGHSQGPARALRAGTPLDHYVRPLCCCSHQINGIALLRGMSGILGTTSRMSKKNTLLFPLSHRVGAAPTRQKTRGPYLLVVQCIGKP